MEVDEMRSRIEKHKGKWIILEDLGDGWTDWQLPQPDAQHALDRVLEARPWRFAVTITAE